MSVPESIAWLEHCQEADTPSSSSIYARTILGELTRISQALEDCAHEVDKRERLRHDAVTAHRALESTFAALEERASLAREEWDRDRTEFIVRLTNLNEALSLAQGTLKDVHYGLLHQPELTREDLARAIESVVTPYPEGAKP